MTDETIGFVKENLLQIMEQVDKILFTTYRLPRVVIPEEDEGARNGGPDRR